MDIATLSIAIDSRQAKTAKADLDALKTTGTGVERSMAGVTKGSETASRAMDRQAKSARDLTQLIRQYASIAAGAFSVTEIVRMADAWQGMENRLRLVTQGQRQLAQATGDVYQIAQRTSQSIDSVAQVYQRFAQNASSLGINLGQVASISETVGKAIAVSGSSAAAAEGALMQFGQALASGVLRGEEFNSIMEGAPGLMQALATGMGKPIGAMRALAAEGKITGDVIVEALTRAKDSVDDQFDTRIKTVSQSFQELQNAMTRFIGQGSHATGAARVLSDGISALADNFTLAANSAMVLAFTALPAATRAVYGFTAAMAKNPLGLLAVGASAAIGYLITFRDEIQVTSEKFASLSSVAGVIYDDIAGAVGGLVTYFGTALGIIDDTRSKVESESQNTSRTIFESIAYAIDSAIGVMNGAGFALMQMVSEAGNVVLAGFQAAVNKVSEILFGFLNWGIDKINSIGSVLGLDQIEQIRAPFLALANDVEGAFGRIGEAFNRGANVSVVQDYLAAVSAQAQINDVIDNLADSFDELGESANAPVKPIENVGKALKTTQSERDKYLKGLETEIERINDQARELEFQNATYGMTEDAILGVTIARLQEKSAILSTIEGAEEELAIRDRLIEAYKRQQAAQAENRTLEEAKKANDKLVEDWKKSVDEYDKIFREGFAAMLFEGGNTFSSWTESLWVTFKTAVADQIYKMFAQPFVVSIVGSFSGFLGGGTGQAAAGAGSNLLGMASGASSLYNTIAGGFTGIGSSVSTAIADMGATMFMGSSGGASSSLGSSLMSSASSLGAAATALSGIAAGFGAGTLISGQLGVGGSDPMVAPGVGAAAGGAIGFAVGGPIGAAIGGLLGGAGGGVINRLFGSGPRTTEQYGWRGSLSADGAQGYAFEQWKQAGGLFGGGGAGVVQSEDAEMFAFLSDSAKAIGDAVRTMAESVGQSAVDFKGFALEFDIGRKGFTDEEVQAAIVSAFTTLETNLVERAIPSIYEFAQASDQTAAGTLKRLVLSLQAVNPVMEKLRLTVFETSLEGANAASRLIEFTGGLEQFNALTTSFYENYYTEAERLSDISSDVAEALAEMGLAMPATHAGFRAMVEAARVAGNDQMVGNLLRLAPAFDRVADSIKAATDAAITQNQQLKRQLLTLLGDTESLREMDLEGMEPANQALQQAIWDLQDAREAEAAAIQAVEQAAGDWFSAVQSEIENGLTSTLAQLQAQFDSLTQSINDQITALQASRSTIAQALSGLNSLFDYLGEQVFQIMGLVRPAMTSATGAAFIRQALATARSTGALPESDALRQAVGAARSGLGTEGFATATDWQRANLMMANDLSALQEIAGEQINTEEQALDLADQQIELLRLRMEQARQQYDDQTSATRNYYDAQLAAAQRQYDGIMGVKGATLSVAQAIIALAKAQGNKSSATSAAEAAANAAAEETTAPAPTAREVAINTLYDDLLNRSVDQAGLEYWMTGQGKNNSLDTIAATIKNTTEYLTLEIEKMYEKYLNKQADAQGLQHWLDDIRLRKNTLAQVEENIKSIGIAQGTYKGYAKGGLAMPGIALVGEQGPELVNFSQPGMVYTASQTKQMLSATPDDDRRSAEAKALASLMLRVARVLEQWDGDGLPAERVEA